MSAIQTFLSALTSRGYKPSENATGYTCRCPAHEDSNPSLSISDKQGRVLLHCHAGCEVTAIVDALGLKLSDLFDRPEAPKRKEVACYEYNGLRGERLLKIRYELPDGSKSFAWFRETGDGTRASGLGGAEPHLYRSVEVREAIEHGARVILNEGEKAAERARTHTGDESLDYIPTCAAWGASSFDSSERAARIAAQLAGARVLAVVDRDDAGRRWAEKVLSALRGVVAELKFVEAALDSPKADLFDHLEAGLPLHALRPIEIHQSGEPPSNGGGFIDAAELLAARIEAPPQILPGWALPDIHLVAGPSYSGKTLESYQIGVQLALGMKVMGQWRYPVAVNSLFIQAEMSMLESQLYLQRVCDGLGVSPAALRGRLSFLGHEHGFSFRNADDFARLERILKERFDGDTRIGMVFVDSISECSGIESQDSREDVREFFRDFVRPWARRFACGVVCAHHTNKQALSQVRMVDDQALISGSEAFVSAVSSARVVLRLRKEHSERFVRVVKGRASREQRSFVYKFTNPPGPHDPVRLDFQRFEDGSNAAATTPTEPSALDRVKLYLESHPGKTFTRQELIEDCRVGRNVPADLPPEYVAHSAPGKPTRYGFGRHKVVPETHVPRSAIQSRMDYSPGMPSP